MPREALATMGARGRTWMARDFAWERIAADMLDVYRWCAGQGNRPGCVVVDQRAAACMILARRCADQRE